MGTLLFDRGAIPVSTSDPCSPNLLKVCHFIYLFLYIIFYIFCYQLYKKLLFTILTNFVFFFKLFRLIYKPKIEKII